MYVYTHVYVYAYAYAYVYVYVYTYIYIYIETYVCIIMCGKHKSSPMNHMNLPATIHEGVAKKPTSSPGGLMDGCWLDGGVWSGHGRRCDPVELHCSLATWAAVFYLTLWYWMAQVWDRMDQTYPGELLSFWYGSHGIWKLDQFSTIWPMHLADIVNMRQKSEIDQKPRVKFSGWGVVGASTTLSAKRPLLESTADMGGPPLQETQEFLHLAAWPFLLGYPLLLLGFPLVGWTCTFSPFIRMSLCVYI